MMGLHRGLFGRRVAVACLLLTAGLLGGSFAGSAPTARADVTPTLVLLASAHAGNVTALLGEEVVFSALLIGHSAGTLGPTESIAVVSSSKGLLLDVCGDNPCIATDQSATAQSNVYQAFVLGGQGGKQVLAKSKPVRVEWKKLPMQLLLADGTDTLVRHPPLFDELKGVPVELSVALPGGASGTWQSVKIVGSPGPQAQILKTCNPLDRCVYDLPSAALYADKFRLYAAEAFDGHGRMIASASPLTLDFVPWQVNLQATGNGTTTGSSMTIQPGQTITLNAALTDPHVQLAAQRVKRFDILVNGSVIESCVLKITCSKFGVAPKKATAGFVANVFDTSGAKVGTSNQVTVNVGQSTMAVDLQWVGTTGKCPPGRGCTITVKDSVTMRATSSAPIPAGYSLKVFQSKPHKGKLEKNCGAVQDCLVTLVYPGGLDLNSTVPYARSAFYYAIVMQDGGSNYLEYSPTREVQWDPAP